MEKAPKLHSKITILIVSTLLNPFPGDLLLAQNLADTGRRKKMVYPILFGLFFNFVTTRLLEKLPIPFFVSYFLSSLVGGLILVTIVWNENMEKGLEYKSKSPLGPLSMVVLIYGMFIVIYFVKR